MRHDLGAFLLKYLIKNFLSVIRYAVGLKNMRTCKTNICLIILISCFDSECTAGHKKKETPLFISIQIIVKK